MSSVSGLGPSGFSGDAPNDPPKRAAIEPERIGLSDLIGEKIDNATIIKSEEVSRGKDLLVLNDGWRAIVIYDAGQQCCEERYMVCDDDLGMLVGKTIAGVELAVGPTTEDDCDEHEIMFLRIKTDDGGIVTISNHNVNNGGYYSGFEPVVEIQDRRDTR